MNLVCISLSSLVRSVSSKTQIPPRFTDLYPHSLRFPVSVTPHHSFSFILSGLYRTTDSSFYSTTTIAGLLFRRLLHRHHLNPTSPLRNSTTEPLLLLNPLTPPRLNVRFTGAPRFCNRSSVVLGSKPSRRLEVLPTQTCVIAPKANRIPVDENFIQAIKDVGIYDDIWQALSVFLPIKRTGVQGNQRTHSNAVALVKDG